MPYYSKVPSPPTVMAEQGWPVYLWGTRDPNEGVYTVTNTALTSNVAAVTVTGWSGPIPAVGDQISISGSSSTSGLFDVTGATVTVTTVDQTGAGVISFALSHANVVSAADTGTLRLRKAVVPEAMTSAGGASIACSVRHPINRSDNALTGTLVFSSGITVATGAMQGSNTNFDADFVDIPNTSASMTNNRIQFNDVKTTYEFVRYNVTAVTGSGTVWGDLNA